MNRLHRALPSWTVKDVWGAFAFLNNLETALSGKIIFLGCLLLFPITSVYASDSDVVDPATSLKDISTSRYYKMAEIKSCKTQYCRALYNVSYALEWLQRRDMPNSLARTVPLPSNYLVDYARKAAYLVGSRRDAAMNCFVAQKIVREITLPFADRLSFLELIEIVNELPVGSETCREGIIAAMPQTPATTKLLKDADEFVKAQVHVNPISRP